MARKIFDYESSFTFWPISKQTAEKKNIFQQTLAIDVLPIGYHSFSAPSIVTAAFTFEIDWFTSQG